MIRIFSFWLALFLLSACGGGDSQPPEQAPEPAAQEPVEVAVPQPFAGHTAYVGATIWDGTGRTARRNATLLVKDGRIVEAPADGDVAGADIVDLAGRFVVPGFINAHGHVSGRFRQ
jgi:adenine deaminase